MTKVTISCKVDKDLAQAFSECANSLGISEALLLKKLVTLIQNTEISPNISEEKWEERVMKKYLQAQNSGSLQFQEVDDVDDFFNQYI